jgi:hypothetical protein
MEQYSSPLSKEVSAQFEGKPSYRHYGYRELVDALCTSKSLSKSPLYHVRPQSFPTSTLISVAFPRHLHREHLL